MNINIKKMRRSLGLSQLEFGEKIGCTQTNVSFIEKGLRNTSAETLAKLIGAFGQEFVQRFDEPDFPEPTRQIPKMDNEFVTLIKEQQRQTNEVIELLRQTIRTLQMTVNKDVTE